jgi:hypothetical protein
MAVATRKVIVREVAPIKSGTGPRGSWTLYRVMAADEHGEVITAPLTSFEELPTGELIDVAIEPRTHERFGTTYTLKRPRAGESLRARVDELEQRVAALEAGR